MVERSIERENDEEPAGAMSFDRALYAVKKRLKLVAAICVGLTALTVAIVLALPDRYDASAIVQIDPRQKLISNLDTVISDLKGDLPTVESEVEIIRSRPVILAVIETLNLRSDPDFARRSFLRSLIASTGLWSRSPEPIVNRPAPAVRDQIAEILNPEPPGTSTPERDEVAVAFAERLKVVRVRTTLLIDIRFSASDATKAALIANTIAETYLKQQIDVKRRANAAASELLEAKIEQMRKKVADAERNVEQWKGRNNVLDAEGQILSEKQLARLMEQTVNARNSTAEARAKFENAQGLARMGDGGAAIAEVLKSPSIQALKDQLANANRKAAELGTRYGPKHPEYIKSRAEVAQANLQLNDEIARQVANLKNEYQVADAREKQLSQNLAQMKQQQINTKDTSFELKDLEREASTSKQMLEALMARYKQTSGIQDFQLPDAHIVEKADIPLSPSSPKRKQLVLLAMIAGLIVGAGTAMLLELLVPGISRADDITRVFRHAHISSLPMPVGELQPPMASHKFIRLVVADPGSAYADAIRSARRQLDILRPEGQSRLLLVSSSIPGEGSEIVASNLAHYYAMTGTKTLLVDCDARLQLLTKQLAPQRYRGLIDQVVAGQPLETAILRDGLTGLHFLPAAGQGPIAAPIPETLGSSVMQQALGGLKSRFDLIVLSAPPLFPILDARILADQADQLVLVLTWQKTPKQLAKKALKALGPNEVKVAGLIINGVEPDAFADLDYATVSSKTTNWGLGRAA